VLPALTPVTEPEVPTVATAGTVLLHTPPTVELFKAVLEDIQTDEVPVIGLTIGNALTVNALVTKQPENTVYDIVAVPAAIPVTVPVVELTVPTLGLLLLHAPPDAACVRVDVLPTHADAVPPIAAGVATTVTSVTLKQPDVEIIYVIFVVPTDNALTTPVVVFTVPTAKLLLLHVPPLVALDNVVVSPLQIVGTPVFGVKTAFTVTIAVDAQPEELV
jgi:hypothetical protein